MKKSIIIFYLFLANVGLGQITNLGELIKLFKLPPDSIKFHIDSSYLENRFYKDKITFISYRGFEINFQKDSYSPSVTSSLNTEFRKIDFKKIKRQFRKYKFKKYIPFNIANNHHYYKSGEICITYKEETPSNPFNKSKYYRFVIHRTNYSISWY